MLSDQIVDKEFIERCNQFAKQEWVNIDKRNLYSKKWSEKNRETLRKCILKYSQSEKGIISAKKRNENRAEQFKVACYRLTKDELEDIKEFYLNCPIGYEVDHIIPIARGGRHSLDNLQYLSKEENRKKSCSVNWKKSNFLDYIVTPLPRENNHKKKKLTILENKQKPKKRRIIRNYCIK